MNIADLRRRLARLRKRRSPDQLPSWWGRASAAMTDDELGAALLWFTGRLTPSPRPRDRALLTDDELADALTAGARPLAGGAHERATPPPSSSS